MPVLIPTPAELDEMAWPARQKARQNAVAALRDILAMTDADVLTLSAACAPPVADVIAERRRILLDATLPNQCPSGHLLTGLIHRGGLDGHRPPCPRCALDERTAA